MIKIFFHQLARQELFEARDFYDDLVFGLGNSFIREVEKTISIIKNIPSAYPIIRDDIHQAVIIKFPYSLLYRYENKSVYLLAVAHQKRKPNYWADR